MSASTRPFAIVVAASASNWGIGKAGQLPWRLPGDMAFFKKLTSATHQSNKRNAVIMGRLTWESIPAKFRPLPERLNIIVTRQADEKKQEMESIANVRVVSSFDDGLALLSQAEFFESIDQVFVIGGGQIYQAALHHAGCEKVYLTRVLSPEFADCDTFMPLIDSNEFQEQSSSDVHTENGVQYQFVTLAKTPPSSSSSSSPSSASDSSSDCKSSDSALSPSSALSSSSSSSSTNNQSAQSILAATEQSSACVNPEELQYLRLVASIIDGGVAKGDRTGTGTLSQFGLSMRFSLRGGVFPLLTTKQVFWRGVAEELLWFIQGCTDARVLQNKNIHIWDGNASREYLDSIGLRDRETGDLGPVYGFQWRHFGAKYVDMHTDYTGQGVDQLAQVIHTIKTNPNDRRIIMSAWNPADLKLMALPPCHMFCQFYVANGELSCVMYQRSCDMGLGVPFNIASYSLLTCMIAQVCDLKPGEFIHMMGDSHVYQNHVEPLKEQLQRQPFAFPTLRINPAVKDIDQFKFEDFELVDYKCHKKIAMKMAV